MLILHPWASTLQLQAPELPVFANSPHSDCVAPFSTVKLRPHAKVSPLVARVSCRAQNSKTQNFPGVIAGDEDEDEDEDEDGFSSRGGFRGKEEERDYDRDPEIAEILGSCLDDPKKAQSKKRVSTDSPVWFKMGFNRIVDGREVEEEKEQDFAYKDRFTHTHESHIQQTIRAWHIVGRLGGCNSMNMQLSQSPLEKRPSYDAIQGANVTPTTFYNIGDLEIQENLARIWVDIGTSEPLILDVLINALTQISSEESRDELLTPVDDRREKGAILNWASNAGLVEVPKSRCIEAERQALLKFKEELYELKEGLLSSWGNKEEKRDCCNWVGIQCANRSGRVIKLDFSPSTFGQKIQFSPLIGKLAIEAIFDDASSKVSDMWSLRADNICPSLSLANLSRLQSLDFSNNYLEMKNWDWVFRLSSLRELVPGGTDLREVNSDFRQLVNMLPYLKKLGVISLSSGCSILVTLFDLSGNFYVNGSIIDTLGNITSLEYLSLSNTRLEESIPESFGKMSSLSRLDLSYNKLGEIPKSIWNLPRLRVFSELQQP
ncbi:LRR domain containing protein [Parasponia andersonii]|uniref:LRR domain containing protein n=1 Tax=Parasponia andersonii TaxID=3476 RepID=A0A2P5A6Y9_PARAD|nr:LRR domain containing protein [Parasponia andersonii]